MSVSVVYGRIAAINAPPFRAEGLLLTAPAGDTIGRIRIGDRTLERVSIPAAALPYLIPGEEVALHLTDHHTSVLFAVETHGVLHDFTEAMAARAHRERWQAIGVTVAVLVLSAVLAFGHTTWPLFFVGLTLVVARLHVPGLPEMRRHIRAFDAAWPNRRVTEGRVR